MQLRPNPRDSINSSERDRMVGLTIFGSRDHSFPYKHLWNVCMCIASQNIFLLNGHSSIKRFLTAKPK